VRTSETALLDSDREDPSARPIHFVEPGQFRPSASGAWASALATGRRWRTFKSILLGDSQGTSWANRHAPLKAEAVRVRESGRLVAKVARELDLTATYLRAWVSQAAVDEKGGGTESEAGK